MRDEFREAPKAMGLWSAASIGVGAMVGAGIFALTGIAVEIAGSFAYVSFIIAGILAFLTSYSFSKLAATFPSKGGSVTFLNEAFGKGIFSGGLNLMTCIGYVVVTALYARAFGQYGMALFGVDENSVWLNVLGSGIVILFIFINFAGASLVGKAGLTTVLIQTGILLLFGLIGLITMQPSRLTASTDFNISGIILVTGIVFMSYEGFGLVANTADDLKNPEKTLPRALYLSVFSVMAIYVLVNIAVIGNLPLPEIIQAKEYVLAEAAKPMIGSSGFIVMGIAALFSTASAINSTIYGPVNMLSQTAESRELPSVFARELFNHESGYALLIIGVVILLFANLLELQAIAEVGSMIFLVVYAAIGLANYKLREETDSRRWIIVLTIAGLTLAFGSLVYFQFQESGISIAVFTGIVLFSFGFQWFYQAMVNNPD